MSGSKGKKNSEVLQRVISSESYVSNSDASADGAALTAETSFLQFTRPIRYSWNSTYQDFGAIVSIQRNVSAPTRIIPTIYQITQGKGDNATFIGVSGGYLQSRDRSDVTALNKGVLYGLQLSVSPLVARNNIPFDDVGCLIMQNDAQVADAKGTDACYIGHNAAMFPTNPEWHTCYTTDAFSDYAFLQNGKSYCAFADLGKATKIGAGTDTYRAYIAPEIQSEVTGSAYMYRSFPSTKASAFNLTSLFHFSAADGTLGAGSSITTEYGFYAGSALNNATNVFGFYSAVASGSGKWGFYAGGTAKNYFGGDIVALLSASVTPANNGELMIQLTDNTHLAFKVKGSDGTVRTGTIVIA